MTLAACSPPATPTPSASPSAGTSDSGASGAVWTEAEVETALNCLEASGDIGAKAVAGQMKFAFLTGQRAKTMPGYSAVSYQQSMNTYGAGLSRLKANGTLNASSSACITK